MTSSPALLRLALATLLILLPATAHANVVWPGLVTGWALLFWIVPAGLLIEYFVVQKYLLPEDAGRAVILANIASAIAGIVLFPILGTFAEAVPNTFINQNAGFVAPDSAKYQVLTLVGLLPLAATASALIEGFVYQSKFGLEGTGREAKIVFAANFASTAVACLMAALFLR